MELFHTGDLAWTSLTSLPTPAGDPSATLTGKLIYVMADWEHGYLCTIDDIVANKKPLPPLIWQFLPAFPPTLRFTPSSCSLGGQLVIVGWDRTIWQLLNNGSWSACGTVSGLYRALCLLTSPSPHTMVAMGAADHWDSKYDSYTVDICIV